MVLVVFVLVLEWGLEKGVGISLVVKQQFVAEMGLKQKLVLVVSQLFKSFFTKNRNAYPSLLHLLGNSSLNVRQKLYPIVVVAHQQLVVYIG